MSHRLGSLLTSDSGNDERISLADIEGKLRSLTSGTREALVGSRKTLLAGGVFGAAACVAASYLLGRRRGRRRATVLEIRRA